MKVLVTQSCPTLCDPVDCSPPGSSVLGILQARILEWLAIPFSRESSWPRDWTRVSCTAGGFFTSESPRQLRLFLISYYCRQCCNEYQVVQKVKNLPANAENSSEAGSTPGSGRSPGEENGNPLQYFMLENSLDRGAWLSTVLGIAKSQTQLKWLSTYTGMEWISLLFLPNCQNTTYSKVYPVHSERIIF